MVLPLQRAFLLCPVRKRTHGFFRGRYTGRLSGQIKFKWEVPKSWLMMQESRLLSYAPSASRETTTQRKTRRMIRTGSNLRNTVSSAASTLFTKSLSDREDNMTVTNKRSLIAFLLTVVLVVSLFTVSISATDVGSTTSSGETTVVTEESSSSDETTTSEETTAKKEETTAKQEQTTKEEKEEEESTESAETKKAKEATKKALIINGIIIGVILIIAAALIIKFREKLGAFMRSVKSELKKISWTSKTQTRKSFLVVVIVAVAVALLLFIVNFAFTNGISMLTDLF